MGAPVRLLAGIDAVLGGWLVAAPFVFGVDLTLALWNHAVVGVLVVLVSGYDAATAGVGVAGTVDGATLVSLLGLWTIASPFLLGFPDPVGFWNSLVVGTLIATIASYLAYVSSEAEPDASASDRVADDRRSFEDAPEQGNRQ